MAKTATLTADQIIKSMQNKDFKPVYLLMGEEEYYIDLISDYAKDHILNEDDKEFNLNIMYGKDINCDQIVMAAKQYPLMADHQVIIVKEAQNIKDYASLSKYLTSPLASSLIVLCHKLGNMDKRKKIVGDIGKCGIVFESKRMYDNQIPMWISQYVKSKRYNIEPKATNLMAEYIGANLSKITNELDKLFILLKNNNQQTITSEIIEENIGISKEYNNFELVNAIMDRNVLKANRIIKHFAEDPNNNPLVVTTSVLFNFFSNLMYYHWLPQKDQMTVASELKINPYFVKDYQRAAANYTTGRALEAIRLLREMDAKSKGFRAGSGNNDRDLLREFIFRVMH